MFAQLNIGRIKNVFGGKKEPSNIQAHLNFLSSPELENRFSGNDAELKVAQYVETQLSTYLFKPYLGKYIHPFKISDKNIMSVDSYVRIYNENLEIGKDVIVPPFSGIGKFSAQSVPNMQEPKNLWFINFTDVGDDLNNRYGDGLEKIYDKAKNSIDQGAEAVVFLNNDGPQSDFNNSFNESKLLLNKPVFILNNSAYKKFIVQAALGKDWIDVDYDFSKTRRTAEGHNVIGIWQNQTQKNIIITARYDNMLNKGSNSSGVAALCAMAEWINQTRLTKYNYILMALSGTADDRIGAESAIKMLKLNSDNVSCVINIDEIGNVSSDNRIHISGVGTSPDWLNLLRSFNTNFKMYAIQSPTIDEENQISFYEKNIPVINIFSKANSSKQTLNLAGVDAVASSLGYMLLELDNYPQLKFSKTTEVPNVRKIKFNTSIGFNVDYVYNGKGVLVGDVRPKGPAEMSNIQSGDVVIKMGDYDITSISDYVKEMKKYKNGDRIMIQVERNGEKKSMLITFKN